jgi:DNA-binding response OmpR family regulator
MKANSKILIVDDDEMTREIIGNVLASAGYLVYKAEDGMQAINLMREVLPDLILLDILLPDINGLELLNLIHLEYLSRNKVPVIIISQLDKPEILNTALKLGADDMIIKPFDPQILIEKISRLNLN